ncbi:S53 family peptidase [Actinocatenispora sera]|uniref:Peptidase S8 n=1 Tax=Actinocatenispora sera TaxID=390989 RepID=A0A810KSY5_9ACTN|nr:S53 family peptidase [Actinocatenispora sera]BCJ25917.1 peptidase S8 [Actinocatenispora sera]
MSHPGFRRRLGGTVAAAGLLAAVLAGVGSAAPAGPVVPHRACSTPTAHHAACLALVDADARGKALSPSGLAAADLHPYQAADLQSAYDLPSDLLGARQTIAIVDAFDDPNAEADLAEYRRTNGLPACDADFPCFRKVNQRGERTPPPADAGWAVEISLDLDMASAACPNCQLLLVEADDTSTTSLAAAVDTAVALGADVVSNSYGANEYSTELAELAAHFDHPGTAIVASSGDSGFGVSVPAALSTVVAVGGTTLYQDSSSRGWGEQAWAGSGSGCSAYVTKPSWQKDRLCRKRTVADVAAVANPSTPVAVYDTYGSTGWIAVGGTSAAAPLVAGVIALAGNLDTAALPAYPYAHAAGLRDVTTGANGTCGGSYLCTATKGYDGPTGLGTPHGIGAF